MAEAEAPGNRHAAGMSASPFEGVVGAHRRAARGYRGTAIGLLVVGAGIAAAGLATTGAGPWPAGLGLVLAATATIPWKKAAEHRDRADGVEVLHEEWRDAAAEPERRARLLGLIRHLYA